MATDSKRRTMFHFSGAVWTGKCEERETDRTPWHTIVMVIVLFYLIDHNVFASTDVTFSDPAEAASKAANILNGSIRRQVSYFAFGMYGLISWWRSRQYRLEGRGKLAIGVLFFLVWSTLSMTWSTAPEFTARRLTALGLMALGISGLLRQLSALQIVKLIFWTTLVYLGIGIGAELALGTFAPWFPGYRFAGTLSANLQGINCAALAFASIALSTVSRSRRLVFLSVALIGCAFLILTGSRGSIAGAVAGLAVMWILKAPRDRLVIAALVSSSAVVLGLALVANGEMASPVTALLAERVPGVGLLTGRADLWAVLVQYARERPVLGYGYGAFFDDARGMAIASRVGTWTFGGPHSIYLGILLDLGAIGLVSLLGIACGSVWKSARAYRGMQEPWYLLFTSLLVFCILSGGVEAELLSPAPQLVPWLVISFVAFRPSLCATGVSRIPESIAFASKHTTDANR